MLDVLSLFDGTLNASGTPSITGVAITTSRSSTNVLDLLSFADFGAADSGAEVHCSITQGFAGGTSLQIELQSSPDNVNWVGMLDTPVMLTANLLVGTPIFRTRLPANGLNAGTPPNRYYRLYYTVVGTMTSGTILSYLAAAGDRGNFYAYPKGYSIDA